ncbi:E3 ubiquitin-protein ligase ORTHRUS 2-like [Phalaenopsis equestris]|uniref:E3 ubiquitin-protein ligase ORTHRUS 2-like n=1 Tax=Phalaenopsis equestris TaxID=78828 RepID=UPI0009E5D077|nr:E3 ubiquitin-protein ligase ORTHRUS 2-like [Phalaenopsis equestris]
MASDLPCDADGVCMVCKAKPSEAEAVLCRTCVTPWHVSCLSRPPETLASALEWQCPDCFQLPESAVGKVAPMLVGASAELVAAIRAIEADGSLTEQDKARRRQALVSGVGDLAAGEEVGEDGEGKKKAKRGNDVLGLLDGSIYCSFCMQLPERPVTTPCGHNFCLKCFQKWAGQGKLHCANCRSLIPSKFAAQPRINSTLAMGIRMAKSAKSGTSCGSVNEYHFIRNENRPDKAYTTDRAKRAGKANACSGQIFVTTPPDHFGSITAEYDPKMRRGVLVGDSWDDRMDCRQWGAHLPHVAGIAGQSEYGAQSVALSGGYQDDEDHGEWFLYTGSGGRDLSGNKRTSKQQSFDQKFDKLNEALRVSCLKGYPVRVVRSHKEKRSSYAPENGVRYDGVYRIEKCWRKVGLQGFKVCRYLFVRCDNEPAPWTSDEHGDRPRPLPVIKELKKATDITDRRDVPSWDYVEEHGWKWVKPPPVSRSRKPVYTINNDEQKRVKVAIRVTQNNSVKEKLLKEFSCLICRKVLSSPLTTPCAHNFCKTCLLGSYADKSFVRERSSAGGRTLRAQKITKKCPACPYDISDFLQNPQINRELMDLIESLQSKNEANVGADIGDRKSCLEDEEDKTKSYNDANDFMKEQNSTNEIESVETKKVVEKKSQTVVKFDSTCDEKADVGEIGEKRAVKRNKVEKNSIVVGDDSSSNPSNRMTEDDDFQ